MYNDRIMNHIADLAYKKGYHEGIEANIKVQEVKKLLERVEKAERTVRRYRKRYGRL